MTAVVFGESRDRELNVCSIGKGRLRQGHFPVYKYPVANTVMEGRKHIATPQAGGIKNKWPEVNKESVQPADLEKILSIMRSWGKDWVWVGDVGASPALRPPQGGIGSVPAPGQHPPAACSGAGGGSWPAVGFAGRLPSPPPRLPTKDLAVGPASPQPCLCRVQELVPGGAET